jgi:hypothetical protein
MKERDDVAELREVIAGARDSLHRTNSDSYTIEVSLSNTTCLFSTAEKGWQTELVQCLTNLEYQHSTFCQCHTHTCGRGIFQSSPIQ